MSDANGDLVGEVTCYTPFGGYRSSGPNTISDRGFTGQKENMADLGLYYYNARYYAPGLGRFLSADTIVPDPANPQSLNRYSYVLNNALNLTDPTGHIICESGDSCTIPSINVLLQEIQKELGNFFTATIFNPKTAEVLAGLHSKLMNVVGSGSYLEEYSIEHITVQFHFVATHPGTLPEVPIPNSSVRGNTGFADLVRYTRKGIAEIWEVKSVRYRNAPASAEAQLARYISNYPGGAVPGGSVPQTVIPHPINRYKEIVYESSTMDQPGIISYWDRNRRLQTNLSVNVDWQTLAKTLGLAAGGYKAIEMLGGNSSSPGLSPGYAMGGGCGGSAGFVPLNCE